MPPIKYLTDVDSQSIFRLFCCHCCQVLCRLQTWLTKRPSSDIGSLLISYSLVLVLSRCLVAMLSNSDMCRTQGKAQHGPSPMPEVNRTLGAACGGDQVVRSVFCVAVFLFLIDFISLTTLVGRVFAKLRLDWVWCGEGGLVVLGAPATGNWRRPQSAEAAIQAVSSAVSYSPQHAWYRYREGKYTL